MFPAAPRRRGWLRRRHATSSRWMMAEPRRGCFSMPASSATNDAPANRNIEEELDRSAAAFWWHACVVPFARFTAVPGQRLPGIRSSTAPFRGAAARARAAAIGMVAGASSADFVPRRGPTNERTHTTARPSCGLRDRSFTAAARILTAATCFDRSSEGRIRKI